MSLQAETSPGFCIQEKGSFAGRPRCAKFQNLGNLDQTRADHGGCFFFFSISLAPAVGLSSEVLSLVRAVTAVIPAAGMAPASASSVPIAWRRLG